MGIVYLDMSLTLSAVWRGNGSRMPVAWRVSCTTPRERPLLDISRVRILMVMRTIMIYHRPLLACISLVGGGWLYLENRGSVVLPWILELCLSFLSGR